MMERKYSVIELDALRSAIGNKWLWGSYGHYQSTEMRMSRSYSEQEKTKAVEDMVRTHMLAGHTAEDLYASENPTNKSGVKNVEEN